MKFDILITGATGFLGRSLINDLSKNSDFVGKRIALYVRDVVKAKEAIGSLPSNILFISEIEKDIQVHTVIHLASFLSPKDDSITAKNLIDSNIDFPTRLLVELRDSGIRNFINTGTFAEFHDNNKIDKPTYLYGATKTAFRAILKYFKEAYDINVINVIPYTIYGYDPSKEKVIDVLIKSFLSGCVKEMSSDGTQRFDFIHVSDVSSFYIYLLQNIDKIKTDDLLEIGSGNSFSLKEIESILSELTGLSSPIKWAGESVRIMDTKTAIADLSAIQKFSFTPKHTIQAGLLELVEDHK